ncbi:PREDICTED: RING-H2 finger protein ATL56-like isoform X2 [Tarenaya hassleriana]|uniref:RING-H2 finger protein ATL56-like isoform X2 n=1 Tax=Tarenaya hassleriana TaxID=28532 RepID=UPI00053C3DBF|nr:PREDICTED: RING-H2 finger protein ATL56-like isoform X2 [Tarenaya hassleriana]
MPPPPIPDGRISGEPPPPPPKANGKILSLFLIGLIMISITSLFFVLLGLASIILLPLLLTSLHRHHSHRRHESSKGFFSRRLKELPQFKFSEPTRYGSDCVVCLDGFRQGQWCRRLVGCGHVFHRGCVDAWLVKVAACPICRARVRLDEEDEEEGDFWACFGQRRSRLLEFR